MAEMLHPDVYVKEIGGVPILLGVGTGTGSFIGTAPSGPTGSASLITNYSQFVSKYGSDGGFLDDSVKAFFDNGGTRCYVIRVIASDAAGATNDLKDMQIDALFEGSYANGISASTTRYTVYLATAQTITSASDNVTLADVSNVELGDIIYFYDGAATIPITVADIIGSVIYFQTPTVGGVIDDTVIGVCPTVHKLSTRVSSALLASTAYSTLTLNSVGALEIGDSVVIAQYDSTSGNSEHWVREVTGISGKAVTLSSAFTPGYAGTPYVTSIEFDLTLIESGEVIETIRKLSANGNSPSFYETIVNADTGSQNVSTNVKLSYTAVSPVVSAGDNIPYLNIPPNDGRAVVLAGGLDGTDNLVDFIGTTVAPRSGLGILDQVRDVQMLSTPGETSEAVILACVNFCELRGTCTYLYHTPDPTASTNYDEPLEVKQWRMQEVNVDSSYAALYYPWIVIDDGNGGDKVVPPVGAIQGIWAAVTGQGNPASTPANVAIANTKSLVYTLSDGEQDILNPIGVNCIREFAGRGIRVWGARTLTSVTDGRHYLNVRGVLNYVKHTIFEGTQWAVFQANDPILWTQIKSVVSNFLHTLWMQGALVPSNDEKLAYYVKCDAETNPIEKVKQGIVSCEVGINPPFPAEFVVFNIGLWDGGGSIGETLG